jgi:hypothetical protein
MASSTVQFSIRAIAQDDRISEVASCPRTNLLAFTTKTNISACPRQSSFSIYAHSTTAPPPEHPIVSTPAASGDVRAPLHFHSLSRAGMRCETLEGHIQPLHRCRRRSHRSETPPPAHTRALTLALYSALHTPNNITLLPQQASHPRRLPHLHTTPPPPRTACFFAPPTAKCIVCQCPAALFSKSQLCRLQWGASRCF